MLKEFSIYNRSLENIESSKSLINTINAHSYNISFNDEYFREALKSSNVLIPDGISIVWAFKFLTGKRIMKIAGADLFYYEMKRIQLLKGKVFFLGSNKDTLNKITKKCALEFPNVNVNSYSPPYKPEFSQIDNNKMIQLVNDFKPDVLFVGMTAPKQEKWAYFNYNNLDAGHICCVGAVFDFYAGNINRAPSWMISLGLEWLFRLYKEPRRMWRRYLIGNVKFIVHIIKEKININ